MSETPSEWQAWLNGLDASQRAAAQSLRSQFEALDADDAEGWAKSEISEDLPHLARFVLLRSLWRNPIDGWADPGALDQLPAAQRLLAAGADKEDLVRLVRAVAYEAVFSTLDELDSGGDVNVSGIDAGWVVMESGEDGAPTGRVLSGLHEDLLTMNPSGSEGADLWQ
ncbi:hypothetical protein OG866_20640 [Streptomyces sp. NBC_00663]|uniref:hypothetical protein n=1 Tax=Streptomyces sp. NBC_00663 TaxID=2975801 RepID=UPI002E37246D|nr:hypothetical protein [Streptomyces sp. NBC_00663]